MEQTQYSHEEIKKVAAEKGLTYRLVTTQLTGYPEPQNGILVYGFDSFEEAEAFFSQYGGTVAHGKWRDGWALCNVTGQAWGPLTSDDYLRDLGDDYAQATPQEHRFYADVLGEFVNDLKSAEPDEVEDLLLAIEAGVKRLREIRKAVENAGDDSVVILYRGEVYQTVPKTMMKYHEDVHTYVVGVHFSNL